MTALARKREFIDRPVGDLLLVEDDAEQRTGIEELMGEGDVDKAAGVGSADAALEAITGAPVRLRDRRSGLPESAGPN